MYFLSIKVLKRDQSLELMRVGSPASTDSVGGHIVYLSGFPIMVDGRLKIVSVCFINRQADYREK